MRWPLCSIVLFLGSCLLAVPVARAQSAGGAPYRQLAPERVLAMGYKAFANRYGKDLVGEDLDNLDLFWADCQAKHTDKRARQKGPKIATQIESLRALLSEWDGARFSPQQNFTGGNVERGHHEAAAAVAREALLESLLTDLDAPVGTKASTVPLEQWLAVHKANAVPLPEELDGQSADEQNALKERYRDWYARLVKTARRMEAVAQTLPLSAGARILRYATTN